ncbi:sensor histidine kinase [Streptomyces sp. NBC_01478]|uniref:sensor histidine kinase n=1 Tax=Streptomyces sp. NBC_01478 TaxID=2903882 RepID=UPI002E30A78C|nr:sensor histidine kinase [Streptomyces sp. NBC_01478]
MPVTPPLPPLKRVPPGAWTGVPWIYGTLFAIRAFFHLPYMPTDPFPPTSDGWVLIASGSVLAPAGCVLLRRRPLAGLGLLLAGTYVVTLGLNGLTLGLIHYAAIDIAVGWIAASAARHRSLTALALAIAVLPVYQLTRTGLGRRLLSLYDTGRGDWQSWSALALSAVVAWLIGNSVRQSRAYTERLATRTATQVVTAERLRIAREMHDTVAHSIGIIALQAGAAARVTTTQPEAAREAMRAVEHEGRETLAGLRRMLVALRAADETPVLSAGLGDIDRLAATSTAAGVRVEVRRRGEPRQLPPDIDLSAFRIVQESVTNVVRHAGTRACRVTLDYRDDELALEVTDDGRGHGTVTDTGFGLAGMRERVALLHGEFTAAPRPEGGFRVAARLPVPTVVAR